MYPPHAEVSAGLFTVYMIYVSAKGGISSWNDDQGVTLFSWHPLCMSLAFGLLSIEAVRTIQRRRSSSLNVQIHSSLNDVAIVLALIGTFAIYSRKEGLGKPHFSSWHAWAGLCTLLLFFVNATHGILRTMKIIGDSKSKHRLQWVWVSSFHRTVGTVSLVSAMAAVILGLYSDWGKNVLGYPVASLLTAGLIMGELGMLVRAGGLTRNLVEIGKSKGYPNPTDDQQDVGGEGIRLLSA